MEDDLRWREERERRLAAKKATLADEMDASGVTGEVVLQCVELGETIATVLVAGETREIPRFQEAYWPPPPGGARAT